MSVLLHEMTREEISRMASAAMAVLPTASIEQHGPHLPVWTDSLLCETVARQAAERAAEEIQVVVAPTLYYGNSHHHFPFAGVLSLTSETFVTAVTEVLEGLIRSGFRKLVVLNGHGGNTELNTVVGLDIVNRLGHQVAIATAAYWDIAREVLVGKGLLPDHLIPGHAGHFETALVMAVRPDLVTQEALVEVRDVSQEETGLYEDFFGATIQVHGTWAAGPGYTDDPSTASAEDGQAYLDAIVRRVADFLVAFHQAHGQEL